MYYREIIIIILVCVIQGCSDNHTTFHEDIKPIIHRNCAICHNPNGAGPFDLITYQDVYKRGQMIKEVITKKYMPPWPADPNYRSFLNQKSLTDDEIKKIVTWIDDGKIEGIVNNNNIIDSISIKTKESKPDLVVKMKHAQIITDNNQDKFLMMKFPFELKADTFIKTINFVPNNKQFVHHINAHLITYNNNQNKNIFKGNYSVDTELFSDEECFEILDLKNNDGSYPTLTPSVANYLPGSEQINYPEGIGGMKANKKNIILVNDFHYGPSSSLETDSSYFEIYFSKEAPKRQIQETQLGTFGISDIVPPLIIKANQVKKFRTKATITKDISLLTINPHMHLLGKSFLAYAITLKNDTIPLIKIDDWNFRWQYFYTFEKMLKIPAGSEIIVDACSKSINLNVSISNFLL